MLNLVSSNYRQRFAAWRSGGFLAQKFNRRAALEPTTKLSYEAQHPPLRQTAVRHSSSVFCRFNNNISFVPINLFKIVFFANSAFDFFK